MIRVILATFLGLCGSSSFTLSLAGSGSIVRVLPGAFILTMLVEVGVMFVVAHNVGGALVIKGMVPIRLDDA